MTTTSLNLHAVPEKNQRSGNAQLLLSRFLLLQLSYHLTAGSIAVFCSVYKNCSNYMLYQEIIKELSYSIHFI